MRAIQAVAFGGPETLEIAGLPATVPAAGEVVIDVAAAPVLFLGTQIRAGLARDWFPVGRRMFPAPAWQTTVGSLGPATDLGCAGQRVVADTLEHGGYLERARVPVERLILVPDRLDLEAAAALLHDGRTAPALLEATEPDPGGVGPGGRSAPPAATGRACRGGRI